MDNDYRFGRVEVSCEGYDYPEDPYVLRGSCGVSGVHNFRKFCLSSDAQILFPLGAFGLFWWHVDE